MSLFPFWRISIFTETVAVLGFVTFRAVGRADFGCVRRMKAAFFAALGNLWGKEATIVPSSQLRIEVVWVPLSFDLGFCEYL